MTQYKLIFAGFFLLFISCQNADQPTHSSKSPTNSTSTGATGASIFQNNCKLCHGADGRLGLNGAKDLTISQLSLDERLNIITHGKNLMAPFGALLSAAEIDSVAIFTLQLSQSTAK